MQMWWNLVPFELVPVPKTPPVTPLYSVLDGKLYLKSRCLLRFPCGNKMICTGDGGLVVTYFGKGNLFLTSNKQIP